MKGNIQNNVVLSHGETILWRGKPKKSAFIATKSFAMLPIAIVWLYFDFDAIVSAFEKQEWYKILFLILHLTPFWIWLANVLTAFRRWKNTTYYLTDRRIIIQGGFLAVNETSIFYKDLRNTSVNVGFIDKVFHTGDISFDSIFGNGNKNNSFKFEDLQNPYEVYSQVQKIILDIQTDIEYPNKLRPDENPGFDTKYDP